MQPVIDTVSKLTPSPPSGGSGVPDKPCFDLSKLDVAQQKADKLKATLLDIQELSKLDVAQQKADKLKATLLDIQELSKTILDDLFTTIEKSFEKTWEYRNKLRNESKFQFDVDNARIRRYR